MQEQTQRETVCSMANKVIAIQGMMESRINLQSTAERDTIGGLGNTGGYGRTTNLSIDTTNHGATNSPSMGGELNTYS